jgi:hypothetical protein
VQAFAFNWLYFEIDAFNLHTHAIRRKVWSAGLWTSAHVPFIMSFALAGSALSKIVLAHDTADADPHDLWEIYEERSGEKVKIGLRWYYCAGVAIALASMSKSSCHIHAQPVYNTNTVIDVISLCHEYKTRSTERVRKPVRIAIRFAVALVILLLPLAHDLNSLHLIALTTCLVVFALMAELAGSSCIHEQFWVGGRRRHCAYSAKTNLLRKELKAALKHGELENAVQKSGQKQNLNLQV